MSKLVEPEWVCNDCAERLDAKIPEGHLPTYNYNTCGICGNNKSVTQPRDYGRDRNKLKVKKE